MVWLTPKSRLQEADFLIPARYLQVLLFFPDSGWNKSSQAKIFEVKLAELAWVRKFLPKNLLPRFGPLRGVVNIKE